MVKLIASLLFSLPNFTFCQVNIVNHSLTDSSLNIAYLGVENSIELIGYKSSNKLSFSVTNGTLTDRGQNQYVLRPAKEGECVISFQNKGQKIISKAFKIDTLGNLVARLAGVKDSFATIQQIISNPFLILEFPKAFFKHDFYIRSFLLSMDPLVFEDMPSFEIVGNTIPPNAIKRIKQMRKGDWLVFEEIIVLCPDCRAPKDCTFQVNNKIVLSIHLFLQILYSLIHQIFIKLHQTINNTIWC